VVSVPPSEYLRSVEPIWVLWLLGTPLLAWLAWKAFATAGADDWRLFFAEEDGAAYTISYALVTPLVAALVALVVETTLFLVVKIGTVHAAYAAARANIVWRTTPARAGDVGSPEAMRQEAERRARTAAVQVMGAFASSSALHLEGAGATGAMPTEARRYQEAYAKYVAGRREVSASYVMRKYRFADRATEVKIEPASPGPTDDITVTVAYEMPFHMPGIGRILGHRPAAWPGARFRTYRIESRATLQNEAPRNAEQRLGIDYVSE
jgi:hypothetical protein